MSRPLVALDIGSTKVACAVGLPHERSAGFELLGTSLVPYPTISDTWLADAAVVGRTIEQALAATGVHESIDQALVTMNHPLLTSERVRVVVPLGDEPMIIRAKDLDRLQRRALDHMLSVDREPLLVERLSCAGNGFEGVRDPRGLTATRLAGTFHIATIPLAARQTVVQAVESAGLQVSRLAYSLVAGLAGASDEAASRQRLLLVDVGGLTSDVGLMTDGMLQVLRIVPWGGQTLATAIARDIHGTMDQGVTWSLEGPACRKSEVGPIIERHWALLQQAIEHVLEEQPRPERVFISGRGALSDGFMEWIERVTGAPVVLCRSPRTSSLTDLSQKIGLSAAIGLLEMTTRSAEQEAQRSPHLLNRLIHHTRTILREYF